MILIAFGTRPEWIKISPVVDKIHGIIPYKLLCTGQHTSLIDKSINQYDVQYLNIENGNNRLDSIVTSILNNADNIFQDVTSVMVQGDTTSAFAIALAAFHRKIKIIHLEAGLRSWDNKNPYPEEFNRMSIGSMADIHLCPTINASVNVRRTFGHNSKYYVVGNTVLDHLIDIKPTLDNKVIITLHRRENLPIMDRWFTEINNLAQKNPHLEFIFPMHINPDIQKYKHLLTNVKVIDPLSHKDLISYLASCCLVITDSGGLQEESSFFKKKCIVCRNSTERTEGQGIFSFLCFTPDDLSYIFNNVEIEMVEDYGCPYGDGQSSQKILEILLNDNK